MFKKTKSKEVGDFAIELAQEFSRLSPPTAPQAGARAMSLARAVDDICGRAAEYQKTAKLGIYGKAKLGTEFKMQLKELGYESAFIDELTSRLLIRISGS
jgi:hypothetical protein